MPWLSDNINELGDGFGQCVVLLAIVFPAPLDLFAHVICQGTGASARARPAADGFMPGVCDC